jgi:hypothetical protein
MTHESEGMRAKFLSLYRLVDATCDTLAKILFSYTIQLRRNL